MENKAHKTAYQKKALLLCVLLALIALVSIFLIVQSTEKQNTNTISSRLLYADIYQNGELKQSIDLSTVKESFTFTMEGESGCTNKIEVRPESIGIISASCPDKLCVHQGFINNSQLPIICLPNRLVIQIRQEEISEESTDIITY